MKCFTEHDNRALCKNPTFVVINIETVIFCCLPLLGDADSFKQNLDYSSHQLSHHRYIHCVYEM